MLEYSRQEILNQIEGAKKSLESDEISIKWLKIRIKEEPSTIRKWLYQFEIHHLEGNVETKKSQLKELAFNLQVTEAAIESQKRDSQLIQTHKLIWNSLLEQNFANEAITQPEQRPAVAFANTLFNLVSKTGFFKPLKKEEDSAQGDSTED